MDFYGMKRKDLQSLCKKHGIPANLKNSEMATRLASFFQDDEEIETETNNSPEYPVEVNGIKENQTGGRNATKVTFRPEADNEVFEFTRSVKKPQRKNVARRSQRTAQDLHQGENIEPRRSTRLAAKIAKSCVEGGTSMAGTFLPAKRSKRLVNDIDVQTQDQRRSVRVQSGAANALMGPRMSNSPNRCSVVDSEPDGASADNMNKFNVNDETQVSVRFTRNYSKNDSYKAAGVVEGNLVDKKTDDTLFKSSERVTRKMKRDRSAEPGMERGTESTQRNLTPKKPLVEYAQFAQEETDGADVETIGSSKKSKTMNQECIKDKPQGIIIIEDSPSYETKAAESVMIIENVLDSSTPDKSVFKSQRTNIQELNCELVEGECEEKLEPATVLMPVMEEKEEVSSRSLLLIECSSPASVPLAISNPRAELVVHTGNIPVKDIASTAMVEEITKTKDETLISTPRSEYAQLEPEEAERSNVEARSSSKKMKKTVGQAFVKDKPQGMAEDPSSTSEIKATRPVVISENVLDSTRRASGDTSAVRNSQELNSEREEEHEQDIVLMVATKDDGEASSLSEFLERSEVIICPDYRSTGCSLSVETTLSPASVQLAMNNPEADLGVPTGHIFVKDIISTVITEEDVKTKEDTLIVTPTSELKEYSSVAKLAKVEALRENSAECCKEVHSSKDDEKSSLEKDIQATSLHGNFFGNNTENSCPQEEMEVSKVGGCMSVGHYEKHLHAYAQLEPEKAGGPNVEARSSSEIMKILSQDFVKENLQGMAEDSPSTSETKGIEPIMISENVLDSTSKVSVDISLVRNTIELNSELMEEEREEKLEQDTVMMTVTKKDKDKEEASSQSEFLIEHSEVSNSESELFVETTPPPALVQLAVSNPESELGVPTAHILVKEIVSTVIAEEDIKTKEEIHVSIPRSVLKEHSFVAKLAEAEAVLENSAERWNEIHSSNDEERGSFENKIQSANRHVNFSKYNTENSSAEEQADIYKVGHISAGHCVNRETPDEFKDDSLTKSERTISTERRCNLNALELSGSLSTDVAALSPKDENVSECLEEDEMKAFSQPITINKADRNALDGSAVFTSPERNLMLMEQLSVNGKIRAPDTVNHHNDEAVESHAVLFKTPEQVLLLGISGLDEVGKEEEHTATVFPDESDVLNTSQNEAINEGESIVVEIHDESDVLTASESHSLMGDFEPDEAENKYIEKKDVELLGESNISSNLERHLLSGDSGLEETRKINYNTITNCEDSFVYTSPERRQHLGNSEPHTARKQDRKEVELKDESAFFTRFESRLLLGESGQVLLGNGKSGSSQYQSHASSLKVILKDDSVFWQSHVAAPDFREATIADSSGSIASKVSYSHESNPGEETAGAEFIPKGSQAEIIVGLDAIQGTSKHSRGKSTHVDSVNLFDFDIEGTKTTMEAERNVTLSSDVLALPAEGNSEIVGEISSHVEVSGTCSLVSEESGPSADFQNQIHDAVEELAVTDNNDVDELIEAKVTKNLDSSGGSYVSGKTCVLAGTEDMHLGYNSEVDIQNKFEKSGRKFLKDEATDPIATAFEEDISLTPEFTVQDNIIEAGLYATNGTSNQSRGHSPHANSVTLFDFDTVGTETTMKAERNVPLSSYILPVPIEGDSETTGKISSHLELARTCSMVLEESVPSTDIQNQINDALEELATTDNNEADELIEAKVTKKFDSSGGPSVSGQTCFLGGTEDEHFGYNSEVDFKNSFEKSGHKFLNDKATDPIATAFENDISLRPDEVAVQNNKKEEAADEEKVRREATPSTEETLNESSENKEYANIGESRTLSEKQVRPEPMLIYRTQSKRHDMKENAPISKIVDNLNVTAPRTSKREPLQDLRKN